MTIVLSPTIPTTPLSTYAQLQASVANWAHRSDLDALIPDFVTLAESRISRDLRLRKQITSTTLTTTAGAPGLAMPVDWLEFKTLSIGSDGIQRQLAYAPIRHMDAKYNNTPHGVPEVYTIEGDNVLFAPTPGSAYEVDVVYYARFPSLITAGTNWLMTNHPNIYLFAVLVELYHYTQNPEQIQAYTARYFAELKQLQDQDVRATHSGSALRIKAI